jgi:diguanylate cyclase (GGDEF)-like protein
MAPSPATFLQAFLDDFERYARLRTQVLESLGSDGYERSEEVKEAHSSIGKRMALARKYVESAGVPGSNIDLFFKDTAVRKTRDALLTAIGAYEHGMVPEDSHAESRTRDQKFGILDAPSLLESDVQQSVGLLGSALVYLDIDHFKQVNTKFTERVVDKTILPQFQRLVAEATEGHGHAYAEGGDEVVILLPNFSFSMAVSFVADLLTLVRSTQFMVESQRESLTISAGVATTSVPEEAVLLPERANLAKRDAKERGRDRASVWTSAGCRPAPAMSVI